MSCIISAGSRTASGSLRFGAIVALALLACRRDRLSELPRGAGHRPTIFLTYAAAIAFLLGIACDFARVLQIAHFALTLATAIIGVALFFGWALKQSFASPGKRQEFRSHWPTAGATFLVLLAAIAFFEFQPFMLEQMFDVADSSAIGGPVLRLRSPGFKSLAAIAAPIGVFVTAFRQQFAEFLKGDSASSQWGSLVLAIIAKVALWIAGSCASAVIWVAFLYLSYWGIANDLFERCQSLWAQPSSESAWPMPNRTRRPEASQAGLSSMPARGPCRRKSRRKPHRRSWQMPSS